MMRDLYYLVFLHQTIYIPFSFFVTFCLIPCCTFDTAPSGIVLIFAKRTIRVRMWQVEIICMEPDGLSVVWPG